VGSTVEAFFDVDLALAPCNLFYAVKVHSIFINKTFLCAAIFLCKNLIIDFLELLFIRIKSSSAKKIHRYFFFIVTIDGLVPQN
jgi:hypothetical protein